MARVRRPSGSAVLPAIPHIRANIADRRRAAVAAALRRGPRRSHLEKRYAALDVTAQHRPRRISGRQASRNDRRYTRQSERPRETRRSLQAKGIMHTPTRLLAPAAALLSAAALAPGLLAPAAASARGAS